MSDRFTIDYTFKDRVGKPVIYSYDVPFSGICDAIRWYFDSEDVTLDGTDNHVWNVIAGLGNLVDKDIIDAILSDEFVLEYLTDLYKKAAEEEFKYEQSEEEEEE